MKIPFKFSNTNRTQKGCLTEVLQTAFFVLRLAFRPFGGFSSRLAAGCSDFSQTAPYDGTNRRVIKTKL
ncbi:hypothetical protein D0T90_01455 [Neisseria animalis]|uniref:Uncharacterized protein n=1 Tax=Neisseria animalis TaxID=492 RepID=A0A5P3MPJ2_NEIAN|nr:hypothetical protein D0T90_01455 [Neisseria animalis]